MFVMTLRLTGALGAAIIGALIATTPAQAQTAQQLNQLNQAIQLCNSPAAAMAAAQCSQLNGAIGLPGRPAQLPANPYGQNPNPYANDQAAQAAQQAYAFCVQQAGVNQQAIMACGERLNAQVGLPQQGYGQQAYGGYDQNTATAMNIANGGAAYRQCIANLGGTAGGINPCTPLLNGGPWPQGVPGGPQQQTYGAPPPPAAPPAAPLDPLAGLLGGR